MKYLIILTMLFIPSLSFADGACTSVGFCGFNPSLPVFGGGPMFNFGESDQAMTNASAHIAWSLVVPLVGEKIGGNRGKWIAGLSWIAFTLLRETLTHAPPGPQGYAYPSEVRTDLITSIVPTLIVLSF